MTADDFSALSAMDRVKALCARLVSHADRCRNDPDLRGSWIEVALREAASDLNEAHWQIVMKDSMQSGIIRIMEADIAAATPLR